MGKMLEMKTHGHIIHYRGSAQLAMLARSHTCSSVKLGLLQGALDNLTFV